MIPLSKALQQLPITTIKKKKKNSISICDPQDWSGPWPPLWISFHHSNPHLQCSNALIYFCLLNTPSSFQSRKLSSCIVSSYTGQSSSHYFTWMPLSHHLRKDSIPFLDRLSHINLLPFNTVWNYFVYLLFAFPPKIEAP